MVLTAPEVSFSTTSLNYGTIDVGDSAGFETYNVFQHGNSTSWANAINMSISFKESTNSSEARKESWIIISTATGRSAIASVGGPEYPLGSLVAAAVSYPIRTTISVPAAATSAGRVAFLLHHRYQYTG